MKVVITGSRGLLGAAMAREFGRGHDIVTLDRGALDITDPAMVDAVFARECPDALVNCVAYNDVDGAEDAPTLALEVNAFAVLTLARAAARTGATLVHFSSDFVFDGDAAQPYVETDRANPRGVYAASKLLGDWFALEAHASYVLRVESLFGPPAGSASRRGSVGMIVDGIRAGAEVPVFTDRTVSPSHTPDIARAARMLLEARAPAGLYHCVNSGNGTWAQIADEIAGALGLPLRMRPMTLDTANLRARRPRYSALSNTKLLAAGVEMPDWRVALREFLAH